MHACDVYYVFFGGGVRPSYGNGDSPQRPNHGDEPEQVMHRVRICMQPGSGGSPEALGHACICHHPALRMHAYVIILPCVCMHCLVIILPCACACTASNYEVSPSHAHACTASNYEVSPSHAHACTASYYEVSPSHAHACTASGHRLPHPP